MIDHPNTYAPAVDAMQEPSASQRRARAAATVDRAGKRLLDALVSATLLVVLLPLIVLIGVAIKLDSPGPVLYRCPRVGRWNKPFWMLKFRKMREDATGPALTVADDSRFTRVGRFLAASKLDELPQLWNVLKGEMSLVGPRPEDEEFVELHPVEYQRILTVKPGMTGLCQLAFAKEAAILDADDRLSDYVSRLLPQKVEIDSAYAARRTLALDLRILVWTAVAVFSRRDVAVNRETAALTLRHRRSPVPQGRARG